MCASDEDAFENVRGQIGSCGIWCGSCVVGNGTLREMSRTYEKMVVDHGLEEWGPKDFDFKEFIKGLGSLKNLPACPGCQKGGGRPACELRGCVSDKGVEDCSQCDAPEACANAKLLNHMRDGARGAGLFVKTGGEAKDELISRWTVELRSRYKFPP